MRALKSGSVSITLRFLLEDDGTLPVALEDENDKLGGGSLDNLDVLDLASGALSGFLSFDVDASGFGSGDSPFSVK